MDKQKIIDFLKTLCPVGKVEFNNLDTVFGFEEALNKECNVYFLASVSDSKKRNKDADITFKNYFYVDFDLRKQYAEINNGEILDDSFMEIYLEFIKDKLSKNGFGDWRYILFTGNGYHFYYVGVGNNYSVDDYKNVIEYYYSEIDSIFNDKLLKTDHACKNIGRIARLPGTMNYGRKDKFGLEIKECIIIEETTTISDKIESIPIIAKEIKEKSASDGLENEAKRDIKKQMINISDDVLDAILNIDIAPLVEDYTGLKLGKDNKNFPDKDGNTGMFVADNILIRTGTGRISDKYKGYNTFLFIREHYNLDNNQTFQRFKDNYSQIRDISEKKKKDFVKKVKEIKKMETQNSSSDDIWIEKEKIDWNFDGYKPSRGLEYIDKEFRKMDENGELIILYGPPGSGKTEFSFFVARANKRGLKTVYFCLELTEDTILKRWSLRKNGLSWEDVDFGRLEQYQKDNCIKHINTFKNETKDYLKMISISQQPTLDQLIYKMEQERKGEMLFIIDNLGKVIGDDNENIRFAEITAKLQTYAYNNRCWIVLQHHTTKPPAPKKDKTISEVFESTLFGPYGFRGSQKIYDNSTRMMEIHRDYSAENTKILQYKHSPTDTRGMIELVFDKGEYREYIESNNVCF